MGGECIPVSANYVMSKWFAGNTFSIAYNIAVSWGFLIMSLNGLIEPLIYNENHLDRLGWCFAVGLAFSATSFIFGIFVGKVHEESERMQGIQRY
jgi:hypothetical protein